MKNLPPWRYDQDMVKRFAFIDVQNTETTAVKVLGFVLDNERLFLYLRERWQCQSVFFYPGIRHGDIERGEIFDKLSEKGAIVRPKYYFVHKNEGKTLVVHCAVCGTDIAHRVNMGNTWKCNCDVEMTIDIIDHISEDSEMFIFTGDGDFEPLIERAVMCGAKVYLVSSARMIKKGIRYSTSRFSTKLRLLLSKHPGKIFYLEIEDWKMRIKKV